MKCAKLTRVDKTAYNSDSGRIVEIGSFISESLTDEEARAWIEKIIVKLDSLSDDGKIMTLSDEEMTADYIMAKSMKVAGGYCQYNGKKFPSLLPFLKESRITRIRMKQCRRARWA